MNSVLTVAAALPVVIWMYLLLARSWFWRIQPFKIEESAQCHAARVAVVIPARDEAASIQQVISSWTNQRYTGPLRVFLIDDHSSDGTAQLAQLSIGDSPRFALLDAPGKPAHWTGKLWAVSRGVEAAREFSPEYYLFTDADIVHAPDTLGALLSHAHRGGYDLVSLMVRLHCATLAERALIPAFVFFFFLLYPPRSATGAAGGCMLVRRESLERAGGIAAIRNQLIDDCALAAAISRTGGRVFLAPADASESLRVYRTFGEIGAMISRTAFTQLRYSTLLLLLTLTGLCVTYVLPVILTLLAHGAYRAAGLLAWLTMSLLYALTVRYYRLSPLWSLALPAIALFYAAATVHSAIRYWQGRGGQWKGRAQAS
jgi:hopene-associated glycosyltransferase HpnB